MTNTRPRGLRIWYNQDRRGFICWLQCIAGCCRPCRTSKKNLSTLRNLCSWNSSSIWKKGSVTRWILVWRSKDFTAFTNFTKPSKKFISWHNPFNGASLPASEHLRKEKGGKRPVSSFFAFSSLKYNTGFTCTSYFLSSTVCVRTWMRKQILCST
jgi:hypothetical protein